jgi:hypothetical protein
MSPERAQWEKPHGQSLSAPVRAGHSFVYIAYRATRMDWRAVAMPAFRMLIDAGFPGILDDACLSGTEPCGQYAQSCDQLALMRSLRAHAVIPTVAGGGRHGSRNAHPSKVHLDLAGCRAGWWLPATPIPRTTLAIWVTILQPFGNHY